MELILEQFIMIMLGPNVGYYFVGDKTGQQGEEQSLLLIVFAFYFGSRFNRAARLQEGVALGQVNKVLCVEANQIDGQVREQPGEQLAREAGRPTPEACGEREVSARAREAAEEAPGEGHGHHGVGDEYDY